MYYVYILRCSGDRLYTGITTDPARRLREHSGDCAGGAKFTRAYKPDSYEALWQTDTRSRAQSLEYRIKKLERSRKTALIADNSLMEEYFGAELSGAFTRLSVSDKEV